MNFRKAAGYKIKTEKVLAFLYFNNKRSEGEIKETIPFTIKTKIIIKYPEINLPKEAKDLYAENYRILKKQVKDGQLFFGVSGSVAPFVVCPVMMTPDPAKKIMRMSIIY